MGVIRPLYQNQLEYTGEDERRGVSSVMAVDAPGQVRTGVIGMVAPNVALNGSTVTVDAFQAMVGSAKGGYFTGLDGVTIAGNITAADPTNPRLDRIVLEVLDPDNTKPGTRGAVLRIITGVAGALPSLPALPALALHVASISVPQAGGGGATFVVAPKFTVPIGVPIPVRNAAERNEITPTPGLEVYRMDTDTVDFVYDGAWGDSYMFLPASAGWDFLGGVKKSYEGGLIRYEFTAQFKRNTNAFTIPPVGSDFFKFITAWLPPNARPARPIDVFVAVVSPVDGYNGQAIFRIYPDGSVGAVSTAGQIGVAPNGYMQIMASWVR